MLTPHPPRPVCASQTSARHSPLKRERAKSWRFLSLIHGPVADVCSDSVVGSLRERVANEVSDKKIFAAARRPLAERADHTQNQTYSAGSCIRACRVATVLPSPLRERVPSEEVED